MLSPPPATATPAASRAGSAVNPRGVRVSTPRPWRYRFVAGRHIDERDELQVEIRPQRLAYLDHRVKEPQPDAGSHVQVRTHGRAPVGEELPAGPLGPFDDLLVAH